MKDNYYKIINLSEKIYRLFLEDLKEEISRLEVRDLSNIQAVLIYNMGYSKVNVGDLTNHGHYLGSNVSYNLRKLVENGYIIQMPCKYDRRSSELFLSKKGQDMYKVLQYIFEQKSVDLITNGINDTNIMDIFKLLHSFENSIRKQKNIKI